MRTADVRENFADGPGTEVARGVVTTGASAEDLPDDFADSLLIALAGHRAWDRETDSVPA